MYLPFFSIQTNNNLPGTIDTHLLMGQPPSIPDLHTPPSTMKPCYVCGMVVETVDTVSWQLSNRRVGESTVQGQVSVEARAWETRRTTWQLTLPRSSVTRREPCISSLLVTQYVALLRPVNKPLTGNKSLYPKRVCICRSYLPAQPTESAHQWKLSVEEKRFKGQILWFL